MALKISDRRKLAAVKKLLIKRAANEIQTLENSIEVSRKESNVTIDINNDNDNPKGGYDGSCS